MKTHNPNSIDTISTALVEAISTVFEQKNTNKLPPETKKLIKDPEKLKNNIQQSFLIFHAAIIKGREAFLKYGKKSNINTIFKHIEKHLLSIENHPEKLKDIKLCSETDYQYLLGITFDIYEKGYFDDVIYMLSVLTLLQPLHVQPYILLATITWKKNGPEAASSLYDQFTSFLKDPLLFFYAADCYAHHKNSKKATQYLEEALTLSKKLHLPQDHPLKLEIKNYLKKLKT